MAAAKHSLHKLAQEALDCWDRFEHLHGVAPSLARERAVIAESRRSIAIFGELNAGKSSLIDCLLGEPLLPVGRFPETGAVVQICKGEHETLLVQRGRAVEKLALDSAALRRITRLTANGQRIAIDTLPDSVLITSPRVTLPPDLILVDTPGLNDDIGMKDRALAAAERADVLVLVANSKQFLTMVEIDALHTLASRRGLDGLVVVVNEFLDEDTEAEFEMRHIEDRERRLDKLETTLSSLGLKADSAPFLSVSARAGANQPTGFGLSQLRAHLFDDPSIDWHALRVAKIRAAVRRGHDVVRATASIELALEQSSYERAKALRQEVIDRNSARHAYCDSVEKLADRVVNYWVGEAMSGADAVVTALEKNPLCRDSTYECQLSERLSVAARLSKDMLRLNAMSLVSEHQQLPFSKSQLERLCCLLDVGMPTIQVPDSRKAAAAKGAAAGAAAGLWLTWTLIGPLITSAAGAATGAAMAESTDKASTATSIRSEVSRLCKEIIGRRGDLIECAMQACRSTSGIPMELDRSRLNAWLSINNLCVESTRATFVRIGRPI